MIEAELGVATDAGRYPDLFLTGGTYTVAEVARLAQVSPHNAREWLSGSKLRVPANTVVCRAESGSQHHNRSASVSFLDLAELVVVAQFLRRDLGRRAPALDQLQRAHTYLREQWGMTHPFASASFVERGGRELHKVGEKDSRAGVLALLLSGEWQLPGFVEQMLRQFDFANGLVSQWYPLGRKVPIVVNPFRAAGRPTVAGTGLRVETLRNRLAVGESAESLAEEYELDFAVVQDVLRYIA